MAIRDGDALTAADVRALRVRRQHLDRDQGTLADTAVLDLGVQDTGPDGGLWALAIRGVDVAALAPDDLATAWTLRGAPHLYRRGDLPSVAAATAPLSDADAYKRIFDAAKPLKAAGIGGVEALDRVASAMRDIVTEPMVKGEVSTALTAVLEQPYVRWCRPCQATHSYEMPFRLAALRAGLELQAGTSPPVLQPIPRYRAPSTFEARHDPVRGYLLLLGPATPRHVAGYVDAPLAEIKKRWPEDAVEVAVDGERRWLLPEEGDAADPTSAPAVTRLLGPFDLFLQGRDREVLVTDPARVKELWPVLGRPGAVLHQGSLAGVWRPRTAGRKLTVAVGLWTRKTAALARAVAEQAERLAAFRGVTLAGVDLE